MRVVSLQVGKGRWIEKNGERMYSAIGKRPVDGLVSTCGCALQGDEQADQVHHGGFYQAVYAFGIEQYPFWEKEFGRVLPYGTFGENLTTEGLSETDVEVGDRFRLGSVELVARCPRIPCRTLAFWVERLDAIEKFLAAERPGIYFSIERQGEFRSDDEIFRVESSGSGFSIVDIFCMAVGRFQDKCRFGEAAELDALPPSFREKFGRLSGQI